jgi:hypothetical protein
VPILDTYLTQWLATMMIKAGGAMLLMAIGKVPRQGFALILHDASLLLRP